MAHFAKRSHATNPPLAAAYDLAFTYLQDNVARTPGSVVRSSSGSWRFTSPRLVGVLVRGATLILQQQKGRHLCSGQPVHVLLDSNQITHTHPNPLLARSSAGRCTLRWWTKPIRC